MMDLCDMILTPGADVLNTGVATVDTPVAICLSPFLLQFLIQISSLPFDLLHSSRHRRTCQC